ncbi:MAG: prepilin-type N-terminal cleavage/methylation domain-containing protein [Deltaproteobacteria bacterium]|nr:prepilin-type N-terminal cleavage/methylation domain-containing protein [Deltaproteobacteria bacterium]
MKKVECGFSHLEMLVVVALVGILATLAIPDFRDFKKLAHNSAAQSDYVNIRSAMLADRNNQNQKHSYLIYHKSGPSKLPVPFNSISLSQGVELNYAYKVDFNLGLFDFDITLIQLRHRQGSKIFRYLDINGNVNERVINL